MENVQSSRRVSLESLYLESQKIPEKAGPIIERARGVHAGLWLDKYIRGQKREDTEIRADFVKQVASIPVPEFYRVCYRRWRASLEADSAVQMHEFEVKGRMVVGLGNESVLETSITLHRTYGVPYIPGSALKGLAASYAHLIAGEQWRQGGSAYTTVFGNTESAGYVTFFDALYIPGAERKHAPSVPTTEYPLHPDIITVHHPDYYANKAGTAPADWDSPTPIPFLSATGAYLIALAAPDLKYRDRWLESVFKILEEALLLFGIGAKTSSGYGRLALCGKNQQTNNAPVTPLPAPLALPDIKEDQQVTGIVANQKERASLQNPAGDEQSQFLTYRDARNVTYPLTQVILVVSSQFPEAANWQAGQQKNCRVLHSEAVDGRLFVFCEPVASKFAGKKKKR
ncbi:MAG TPA: type III-B CRISPR module RAMP protein Cmr6 [Ktedonobacteraceae bacterium]|nr:type III-B CRISPR module RAMP protein Cmr6 [Ktedonobacteraceae bacterium]